MQTSDFCSFWLRQELRKSLRPCVCLCICDTFEFFTESLGNISAVLERSLSSIRVVRLSEPKILRLVLNNAEYMYSFVFRTIMIGTGLHEGNWEAFKEQSAKVHLIEPVLEGVLQMFFQYIILYIIYGPGTSIAQSKPIFSQARSPNPSSPNSLGQAPTQ